MRLGLLLCLLLLPESSVLVFPPNSAEIPETKQGFRVCVCARACACVCLMRACVWSGASCGIWGLSSLPHLAPLNLARLSPGTAGQRGPAVLLSIWGFWASAYFKRQGLESLKVTIRLNLPTFACLIKSFAIWPCTLISGHSPAGVSSLWLRDSINSPLTHRLDALQNSLLCRLH